MSDTFDHQLTAFESQCDSLDDGSAYGNRYSEYNFEPDPMFYHSRINFVKLVSETEKSYLLQLDDVDVWVPKSICINMTRAASSNIVTAMDEEETELLLLSGVHEAARAVLRYRGVDVERTEKAYQRLYSAVHRVNDFYLDTDNNR